MSPNGKGISSGVEIGTSDHVLIPHIDQPHNLRVSSIPQINRITQPHSQQIGHRPVNQVKVVVVVQPGGVQYLCWNLVDAALFFGLLDFGVLRYLD